MSPDQQPHVPPPSLWPIGFAIGIACILTGLVVSWPAVAVGVVLAVVFGFLWIRDVTGSVREPAPPVEPESRGVVETSSAKPLEGRQRCRRSARRRSPPTRGAPSSRPTTLGLGAVIGGIITVPVLGFAVLPSFTNQEDQNVELGPLEDFPEGEFVIATYLEDPEIGEVTRRTVFVRYNGLLEDQPSYTVLFSRCVHLGCPVQPNGLIFDDEKKTVGEQNVELTPTRVIGFGCPCHGGQYDTEGNRTAGPPVRSLDRAQFSIRDGKLWLGSFYSVGNVESTGAQARIMKYGRAVPGVHVDGPEAWLYPIEVPTG